MTSSLNKISTIVEQQLPRFIREDHPVFVEFLQKYYEFLEQPGNPVYELKKFENNYDIDDTREALLKYFKSQILPSFPEQTELSTERIIKASRDFYAKKGTPDSFKFLFKVLYDKDVDVFFPKLQILKASDGKWMQPQAFRISLAPNPMRYVDILNSNTIRCSPELSESKNVQVGDLIEVSGVAQGSGFLVGYTDPGPKSYYVTSIKKQDNSYYFTLSETKGGTTKISTGYNVLNAQGLSPSNYTTGSIYSPYTSTNLSYDGLDIPTNRYTILDATEGTFRGLFLPKVVKNVNYELSYYIKYNGPQNRFGTYELGTLTIDITTSKITLLNHGLTTGDTRSYYSNGGTALARLVNGVSSNIADGTALYVIVVDEDTIQLASSATNATAGVALTFTNVGNNDQYITYAQTNYNTSSSIFLHSSSKGSPESTSAEKFIIAKTAINAETGVFNIPNHGLVTGQPKVYNDAGDAGGAISGFKSGSFYYVIKVDTDNIKFASTYADAIAGTAIIPKFTPIGVGAGDVNLSTGELTFTAKHGFTNGYAIQYNDMGKGPIGGLTSGQTYYAIVTGDYKIKLATTLANATAATPVAITGFTNGGNNNQKFQTAPGNDNQYIYGYYNAGKGTGLGTDSTTTYTLKYLKNGWYKITYPFRFDYVNKNAKSILLFGFTSPHSGNTAYRKIIPTSSVDLINDTITINNHGFTTGKAVCYVRTGNSSTAVIGGLAASSLYYVIVVDENTIRLAKTKLEALTNVYIAFSSTTGNDNQYLCISDYTGESFDIYGAKLTSSGTGSFTGSSTGLSFNNLTKSASSVDLEKLKKKRARGSISKASCVVESANRTMDKDSNQEMIEIYVSSLTRFFRNGEYVEIEYVDDNGQQQIFSEKIIGAISNIKVDPKRRGKKYHTGDPIVITGGLDELSLTKRKAVAAVGNTTLGSIDRVIVKAGGQGFRIYPNSTIELTTDVGYGANLIVSEVYTDAPNLISIPYCTDSILYRKNAKISNLSDDLLIGSQTNYKDFTAEFSFKSTLNLKAKTNSTKNSTAFKGYIDDDDRGYPGAVLHVTTAPTNKIKLQENMVIRGSEIPEGTYIVSQKTITGSETYGGIGRYVISTADNKLKEFSGYITHTTLNVSSTVKNTGIIGQSEGSQTYLESFDFITGGIIPNGTFIGTLLYGDAGTSGSSWQLNQSITPSATFTGYISGSTLHVDSTPTIALEYDSGRTTYGSINAGSNQLKPFIYNFIKNNGDVVLVEGVGTSGGALLTTVSSGAGTGTVTLAASATSGAAQANVTIYNGTNTYLFGTSGASSIPWNTRIIRQLSGTPGGVGTYQLSASYTIGTSQAPITITAAKRYYFNDPDPINKLQLKNYIHAQSKRYSSYWGFANNSTSDSSTQLYNAFTFDTVQLGSIKSVKVVNGGGGFYTAPKLNVQSLYETDYSVEEGVGDRNLIVLSGSKFLYEPYASKTVDGKLYVGQLELIEDKPTLPEFSEENSFYLGWRIWVENHFRTVIDYTVSTDDYGIKHKILTLDRAFEGNINQVSIKYKDIYLDPRPNISWMGRIGSIQIVNAGSGYAIGDVIQFIGTGIGAQATVSAITGSGGIYSINLSNKGEGYPIPPQLKVVSNTGTNAELLAYMMADNEALEATTTSVGQVMDINVISRGSDYITAPNVSLRVCDIFMDSVATNIQIIEGDIAYQGTSYDTATFKATVDSYDRANNIVRVYNYSGTEKVAATIKFLRNYAQIASSTVRAKTVTIYDANKNKLYDKIYPWRYGDGRAKANTEFLNGLIKYNGYYLNTDGHLSADKKLQDSKKYHNFSYALSSEVQYSDYKKTVTDISHPMGTKMIPITVKSYGEIVGENITINAESTILTTNLYVGTCNVGFDTTLVDGGDNDEEHFDLIADVGDMIHLNPNRKGRDLNFFKQIVRKNKLADVASPTLTVSSGGFLTIDTTYYIYVVAHDSSGNTTSTFYPNINWSDSNYLYNLTSPHYAGKQNFNWIKTSEGNDKITVSWTAVSDAAYYTVWLNSSTYKHVSESWYHTTDRLTTTSLEISSLSSGWIDEAFPPMVNNTTVPSEDDLGDNYLYIDSTCNFVGDGRISITPESTTAYVINNEESVATKIIPAPFIYEPVYFVKDKTSEIKFRASIDNGTPGVAGNRLKVLSTPSSTLYAGMAISYTGTFGGSSTDITYDPTTFGEFASDPAKSNLSGATYPVILEELLQGEPGNSGSVWRVNRSTLLKDGKTSYPQVSAGGIDVVEDSTLIMFKGPYSNSISSTDGVSNRLQWNSDGWDTDLDLSDVATRSYKELKNVLNNNIESNITKAITITSGVPSSLIKAGNYCKITEIGNVNWYYIGAPFNPPVGTVFRYNGNDITGSGKLSLATRLIMKDTIDNKYYTVQFIDYAGKGSGGVSYYRNLVDPKYTDKADRIKFNLGSFYKTPTLTIGSGNTTTTVNINTANYVANTSIDDYYVGMTLKVLTQPTGLNVSTIVSYNAATQIATVSPALAAAPTGTSNISIFSTGSLFKSVVAVSGSTITLNNYVGIHTSASNILYEVHPSLNVVEYEIVKTGYVAD